MSANWGDLSSGVDTESGIAAIEREQMTKPRALDVEGPALHQPSTVHVPPTNEPYPTEPFALDNLTLHTIKLIQYVRKVKVMIQNVQHQLDSLKTGDTEVPSFPLPPPIPEAPVIEPTNPSPSALGFLPKNTDSAFVRGEGTAPPEIDRKSCRRVLRRSVAAIIAHAGYDNCGESILDTMTDVCQEYVMQMTRLLRRSVDSEAGLGATGFPDALEQTFHEMGVGSMRGLHDFYQSRVVSYHHHMVHQAEQLRDDYLRVRNPEFRAPDDVKVTARVKEEPLSDIQFPTLEECEDNSESDQTIPLEGLVFDMNMGQEAPPPGSLTPAEEGAKWPHNVKSEASETSRGQPGEPYVQDGRSSGGEAGGGALSSEPPTPTLKQDSEGGESLHDPGSMSGSDIMSPPSAKPPAKKMKRE